MNVHRIPTNLVLRFALMSPLSGPNFSPIGARIRVLWRILQSVRKEVVEEENEEKKPTVWPLISRNWLKRFFFQFGMWTPLASRHFCSNFGFNRIRNHGATKV